MLAYQNVSFRYSEAAPDHLDAGVSAISLDVAAGACLLLLGPNGSGKSTLVRLANGLIPHFYAGRFTGSVVVAGHDTRRESVRALASSIGVVFQNQEAQLCNPTVRRDIAFGPGNLRLPRQEIVARVAQAAAATDCAQLLDRPISQLSGGERARVAIAGVLAMAPPLLVLDEPTALLDPATAATCWDLLARLHQQGTAIVVTDHRPDRGWQMADEIATLATGQLTYAGPLTAALRWPARAAALPLPSVTRLFLEAGLPDRPLTVAAAVALIRRRGLVLHPGATRKPVYGEPVLVARGVSASRAGRPVLHEIDLTIRRGEIIALLGPNGAGKTTLLRLLSGIARPDRGTISDARGVTLSPADLGLALQGAADALFCRAVREEIAYSARRLGRYDAAWLDWLIAHFALPDLLDRPPLSLSSGQQRRVALAATLSHRPALVLLDEPTVGLDQTQRAALTATLEQLRASGMTILLATHDLEFAAHVCDRWVVLAGGALIADAPPAGVLNEPRTLARAHLHPTPIAALAEALDIPYPGEEARLAARGGDHDGS